MKLETLYKTEVEPKDRDSTEYYQLHFERKAVAGISNYFVSEEHGWWASGEGAFHVTWTFKPDEGFSDKTEAEKDYQRRRKHRASEGFIHSYQTSYPSGEAIHEIIQVD